jgi:hypothetical protein
MQPVTRQTRQPARSRRFSAQEHPHLQFTIATGIPVYTPIEPAGSHSLRPAPRTEAPTRPDELVKPIRRYAMRRRQSIVTLFAGLAVAAILLGLSYRATANNANPAAAQQAPAAGQETPAAGQETPAAGQETPAAAKSPVTAGASPTQSATEPAKPPQAPPLNVTWAGEVKGAGTLAISAKGDKAIAYLCDGRRLEAWFTGTAKSGKLSLTGAGGAKLTGTFGNGRATGTVTAGGRSLGFDLAAVKKPSGLYRATANVRGARIVGGWIQLPNGEQVGLATVDGTVVTPSKLDLATGTATVDGVTVMAVPASGEL